MALDVLDKILTAIKPLVQAGKYGVAGRTATDFKTAYYLESREDVFLGEVLESICIQIARELTTSEIPDSDSEQLKAILVKYLDTIIINRAKGISTHDVLVDMRYDVTVFQFTVAKMSPPRLPLNPRQM